tara:strand:+ start:2664 stop:3365 length:702 start_codon:yes stop_codon:yes gene_type:complete
MDDRMMFGAAFYRSRNINPQGAKAAPAAPAAPQEEPSTQMQQATLQPKAPPQHQVSQQPTPQQAQAPTNTAPVDVRKLEATVAEAQRDLKDLRSRLDATQERVKELGGSLTAFSQQVAAIKPEIVHAKKMSDEELDAFMKGLASQPGRVLTVGATWCPHCNAMVNSLQHIGGGVRTTMLYADRDGTRSPDPRVVAKLGTLEGYPTTYETTGSGFRPIGIGRMDATAINSKLTK